MSTADRKPVSNTRRIVAMQLCLHATQEFHGEYCDKCLQLADETISALEAAGHAVVPKEPTAEMRDAADNCEAYATYYASAERIWDAMLKAAKEAP